MVRANFFRGFAASLSLNGVEFVNPLLDDHQSRFGGVVHEMNINPKIERAFPEEVFNPSPFTGRYFDFINGLRELQGHFLLVYTPYAGFHLDFSPSFAKKILNEYSSEQRDALGKLAEVYAMKK